MTTLPLLAVLVAGNPLAAPPPDLGVPSDSLVAIADPVLAAPPGDSDEDEDEGGDDLQDTLYEPDFIVDHQKDIGLDDKQRNAIIDAIANAQGDLVRNRWKLQAATADLRAQLSADKVDEAKALAKADEVMNVERDVKRAKLSMLIKVKNLLTADQRKKLDDLRDEGFPFAPGSHRRFMERMKKQMRGMQMHHGDDDDDDDHAAPPAPPVPPKPPKP